MTLSSYTMREVLAMPHVAQQPDVRRQTSVDVTNGTYFSRKPFAILRLSSCLGFINRA